MNMLKKTLLACAALMVCGLTAASAQEKENPWFIQGQIGASYSSGDVPFGKLPSWLSASTSPTYGAPAWRSAAGRAAWVN